MSRLSKTMSISTKLIVINYCILLWVKMDFPSLMTQFSDISCFREETPNGWNIFFQSFLTSQYTLNRFFHAKAARLLKMAALSLQILLHPWKMAPLSTLRFRKSGTHSPVNGAVVTLLT